MGLLRGRVFFMRAQSVMVSLMLATGVAAAQSNSSQSPPATNAEKKPVPGQAAPGTGQSTPPPEPNEAPAAQTPMEFESHGMEYQARTRDGITVMFAVLPPHIKDFNMVQVTVTNGSLVSWTVKPSDFSYVRQDGTVLQAVSADEVVASLLQKASRTDVIKLQLLYEDSIYALSNFRSTNGYEQRREAAMAQFVNRSFKAAAEASAIILVATRLKPGDSTDGAVFFETRSKDKTLGPGRFIAHTCGQKFEFQAYSELKIK